MIHKQHKRLIWGGGIILVASLVMTFTTTRSAQAQGTQQQKAQGTIYLKGGGVIHGDLMEIVPNQYVNIKLSDGTTRKFDWSQIDHVDDPSAKPASGTPGAVEAAASEK